MPTTLLLAHPDLKTAASLKNDSIDIVKQKSAKKIKSELCRFDYK